MKIRSWFQYWSVSSFGCTVQEGSHNLAEGALWPPTQWGWSLWPGRRCCRPRGGSDGTGGTLQYSWHQEECREKMQPGASQCCMARGWEAQAVSEGGFTPPEWSPGQPRLSLPGGTLHSPVRHSVIYYWKTQMAYLNPSQPWVTLLPIIPVLKFWKQKLNEKNRRFWVVIIS